MDDVDPIADHLRSFYRSPQPADDVVPRTEDAAQLTRRGLRDWPSQVLATVAIVLVTAGLALGFRVLQVGRVGVTTPPSSAASRATATPARFTPRYGASMAFDRATGAMVVFGGISGNPSNQALSETWSLTPRGWRQEHSTRSPGKRTKGALAYDERNQVLILFGGEGFPSASVKGQGKGSDTVPAPLNDTWTWNGVDWLEHSSSVAPSERSDALMAFDDAHVQAVLFGGLGPAGSGVPLGDTWTWDGSGWKPHPAAGGPAGWSARGMAYDAARHELMLFAALPACSVGSCQTWQAWAWTGAAWSLRETQTLPEETGVGTMLVADPARGTIVMFGGQKGGGMHAPLYFSETWTWDGGWTLQHPAVSPPQQDDSLAAIAYDENTRTVLLLEPDASLWRWDGMSWTD